MTHEELLAKIKDDLLDETTTKSAMYIFREALLAVVELHKPMKEPKKSGWFEGKEYKEGYVFGCEFDNYHYPCPTIQAIEKELQ